ncbi:MAG TPA: hypothetical protein VFL67_14385, partial [Mycobacterium sp.]|nr:hypothetical protein [Mycobacterium sp.]
MRTISASDTRGDRTASLTGLRAVAALLILGTRAAYGT